jgi:dienelactone hydrolase
MAPGVPGVLVVAEERFSDAARALRERCETAGWRVEAPPLSARALADDRAAVVELAGPRDALVRSGADPDRLALAGFGRGGTLAFLCACAWRVRATVDVEGALAHAALSKERPIQPLELALNFEGSLLVLRAESGSALEDEELRHLDARLSSAGRPCVIVVAPELAPAMPREVNGTALATRIFSYLTDNLAEEPD